MIPKIICWIFGHKRRELAWTGEKVRISSKDAGFWGEDWFDERVYKNVELKNCPRCGVKL